ncbi:MAG: adenylyl cyclase, partial [Burkholderiales bacterium]|nr:adenylyl cyclase [Burkholderiales bacterium]
MRNYDHAIATIMQMHNPAEGQRLLAASYAQLGNMKMARQHADILLQVHPHFSTEKWAGIL